MKQNVTGYTVGMLCILFLLTGCTNTKYMDDIAGEPGRNDRPSIKMESSESVKGSEEIAETQQEPSGEEQETGYFLPPATHEYARQFLSEAEQIWYCEIQSALATGTETITLSESGLEMGLDYTCIDKIYRCIEFDHPELFYVNSYNYTYYTLGDDLVSIEFNGVYQTDRETTQKKADAIEEAVQEILAGVTSDMSQYDIVKYVYETIVLNTDYDSASSDNQNMYSVLINHASVCQGYAKAAQYLLDRCGLECLFVRGVVKSGENHSWNMVNIDGDYYWFDATWGDPSYVSDSGEASQTVDYPVINYDYLNITTEELNKTHVVDDNVVALPKCVATDANYFRKEGYYLQEYDLGVLAQMYQKSQAEGKKHFVVKCGDEGCYHELKERLFQQGEIFNGIIGNNTSILYINNDEQFTMTLWVTNE